MFKKIARPDAPTTSAPSVTTVPPVTPATTPPSVDINLLAQEVVKILLPKLEEKIEEIEKKRPLEIKTIFDEEAIVTVIESSPFIQDFIQKIIAEEIAKLKTEPITGSPTVTVIPEIIPTIEIPAVIPAIVMPEVIPPVLSVAPVVVNPTVDESDTATPPEAPKDEITDDEVRAYCKKACKELGCMLLGQDKEYVVNEFIRGNDRGKLYEDIKRNFAINMVQEKILVGASCYPRTQEDLELARELAKGKIAGDISQEKAIQLFPAIKEILQIAKEEKYTPETTGSKNQFVADTWNAAITLTDSEAKEKDNCLKDVRESFRGMVENYQQIKEVVPTTELSSEEKDPNVKSVFTALDNGAKEMDLKDCLGRMPWLDLEIKAKAEGIKIHGKKRKVVEEELFQKLK